MERRLSSGGTASSGERRLSSGGGGRRRGARGNTNMLAEQKVLQLCYYSRYANGSAYCPGCQPGRLAFVGKRLCGGSFCPGACNGPVLLSLKRQPAQAEKNREIIKNNSTEAQITRSCSRTLEDGRRRRGVALRARGAADQDTGHDEHDIYRIHWVLWCESPPRAHSPATSHTR